MSTKTNKSFLKRIKVTPSGKLMARKVGKNHLNSKQSGEDRLAGKSAMTVTMTAKSRARFLPFN
jgi:ribosomal protein L35